MEHVQYGKDVAYVVLDQRGNVLVDSTYNGFDEIARCSGQKSMEQVMG